MKICVIAVNKTDYAPQRLIQEGLKRGHEMYLTTWNSLHVNIGDLELYIGDLNKNILDFDAILPRSPRFTIQKNGEKTAYRLGTILRLIIQIAKKEKIFVLNSNFFSSYQSIDKVAQQFLLKENNIPGLDTCFATSVASNSIYRNFGFPLVVKTVQGSLGKGVFKVHNKKELDRLVQSHTAKGSSLLFQKYYKITADYRVLVIGKKAIGAIKRSATGEEWRTNVSLGGVPTPVSTGERKKLYTLAQQVAHKAGLDYAGIDILQDEKVFRVIEINSLAQFQGFEKVLQNINVAEAIIKLAEKNGAR